MSRPARCCEGARRDGALRPGRLAALAALALLAACQPLPHPFADDRPPAELLDVPESAFVSVAPIEGGPQAIAAALGAATARALLRYEIPASEKSMGHGSYQLYGRLQQSARGGKSAVAVVWRLEDARGREIGERGVGIEGSPAEWREAGSAMVERLAALSADAVAPLVVKQPASPRLAALDTAMPGSPAPDTAPPPKPPAAEPPATKPAPADLPPAKPTAPLATAPKPEGAGLRVAVRRVTGAPGDGGAALARALAGVLRQQKLTIVDPGDKADVTIDGEVSLAPAGSDKQHVKIVWRVRGANGAEIGNVGQENDVPRGLLSGAWGEIAYVVALAAGDGLAQLFARAAPAATGTEAASAPPNPGPPGDKASQPAASAVKAARTRGQR